MSARSHEIERAMSEAAMLCAAEGITDPRVVLQRKLEAREQIKKIARDRETIARMEAEDASRG